MKKPVLLLVCFVNPAAQAKSGLNRRQFTKYWCVESEAPDYQLTFSGDTCEILLKATTWDALWNRSDHTSNTNDAAL